MTLAMVLDIETAPDRALLHRQGLTIHAAQANPSLHRLSAYAGLSFEVGKDSLPCRFDMTSALVAPESSAPVLEDCEPEGHALATIDAMLQRLGGGLLITFNGGRHDLPLLTRRRAAVARRCIAPIVARYEHCDMMHQWRRAVRTGTGRQSRTWPSLAQICAQTGIPHDVCNSSGEVCALVRKCETDVLATFLLYLLHCAGGDCEAARFCSGWTALAGWCLAAPMQEHRRQFAFGAGARAAIQRTLGATPLA